MKNFIQDGENITAPAPYAVTSGGAALIGAVVAIASTNAASGQEIAWKRRGIFSVPKAGSQAWTAWTTKIYWDNSAKVFTSTSSGNTLVGVAAGAVGSGAGETTGKVLFTGQIA